MANALCLCLLMLCSLESREADAVESNVSRPREEISTTGLNVRASNDRTILLVDDHDILYRADTRRALHHPRRHDQNPLIPQTKPWEAEIGYCSVYHDAKSGRYQLWYQAYSGKRTADQCTVCYAESADGIHWIKPDLHLHTFEGKNDNNIVLVGNGGTSIRYGASVIVDPSETKADRRYKMAYWDFAGAKEQEAPGLCVAFSADGIHWEKYHKAPVLKGAYSAADQPDFNDERSAKSWNQPEAISDVIDVMYDPARSAYVIYAKTWIDGPDGKANWKRAVLRSQSDDFVNWTKPQLVVLPDEFEVPQNGKEKGPELHGGPVFFHADVYFSLLQVLDLGDTGTMPTELALSRDGLSWNRPFQEDYFLSVSEDANSFDAGCIWTNATPVFLKDEIRFYYGAYQAWVPGENPSAIGLAILPRDRFAGVRPIDQIGQITFKPLDFHGVQEISLNANANDGNIRAELFTEDGFRVRGYTKEEATIIRGDSLRHTISWKEKSLKDLPAGRYRLRLHMDNAEVFAITLCEKG